MENVKSRVIESVAEYISSSSTHSTSQSTKDGHTELSDLFMSNLRTASANMPFIKGISSSKVADSYWEKRQDKATGETTYFYAMKYPFPESELRELIAEFERRDREMSDKYAALETALPRVGSTDEIDRAIASLEPLIAYFFDDVRRTAAVSLQASYRKLYDQIMIRPVDEKPGRYEFAFLLGGKEITTPVKPVLKSETLTQLRYEPSGSNYVILYDYTYCEKYVPNEIQVSFRFGNRYLQHKIYYTERGNTTASVVPDGEIVLDAAQKSDTTLAGITVRMTIRSQGCPEFTVRGMMLNIPGVEGVVIADGIDQTFKGNGEHTLKLSIPGPVTLLRKQDGKINLLRGSVSIECQGEGAAKSVKLAQPMRCNW